MDIITSTKNEKIKNVAALLKSKKERDAQKLFVVEGMRITRDALRSAAGLIMQIYVRETFFHDAARHTYSEFETAGFPEQLPVTVVADHVFTAMSETVTPQGILCVVRQPEYTYADIVRGEMTDTTPAAGMVQGANSVPAAGMAQDAASVSATGTKTGGGIQPLHLLILEDIQDPGNLGTMVRTAEAAGMDGIIMSRGTADIFSPKVIRSTMGGIFRMPFIYTDSLCETIRNLQSDGVSVYAAYLRDGRDFRDVDYPARSAIMIGNEGNGLTDEAVGCADANVFIPMQGEVESLNAGVAAALIMYEMGRKG